jgi:hypothetical protein
MAEPTLDRILELIKMVQEHNPRPFIVELLKVRDKANNLIPFEFQAITDYLWAQSTGYDLYLKPRQVHVSTMDLAEAFAYDYCIPYYQAACLSHEKEATIRLFRTVARFFDHLPDIMKTEINPLKHERADYLDFQETDSTIYIGTAGNREFGRSETINHLIISEEAHYKPNSAELVLPAALESVPSVSGGIIKRESTANGLGGSFHEAYVKGKAGQLPLKAIFVPWFWHEEYRYGPDHPRALIDDRGSLTLSPEERDLQLKYGLSEDQIRYRRSKKSELGNKFGQEFPEDDVSCWLSTQQTKFSTQMLTQMLAQSAPSVQNDRIPHIPGLQVYKLPQAWATYSIGADAAEGLPEPNDASCGQVIHDQTGEFVAVLHDRIPEDQFARRLAELGKFYNEACIGVERGLYGEIVIRVLQYELGYDNLFRYREPGQDVSHSIIGFPTNQFTKKVLLIEAFASAVDTADVRFNDAESIREVLEFKKNRDGTYGAPSGRHDDRAMAAMIANHIRLNKPRQSWKAGDPNQGVSRVQEQAYPSEWMFS